jgi:2-polyprenyl-6-methoxyphenol hydroxylase-like FAD-dependent oxidoreductase
MQSLYNKAADDGKAPFKVLIVGAGLGGLSCAIACRRQGVDVEIVERAPKIEAVRCSCS